MATPVSGHLKWTHRKPKHHDLVALLACSWRERTSLLSIGIYNQQCLGFWEVHGACIAKAGLSRAAPSCRGTLGQLSRNIRVWQQHHQKLCYKCATVLLPCTLESLEAIDLTSKCACWEVEVYLMPKAPKLHTHVSKKQIIDDKLLIKRCCPMWNIIYCACY